jgi:MFS family permease
VLAAVAALGQPWVGRAHDGGRLSTRAGIGAGAVLTALGVATPLAVAGLTGLLVTAVTIGLGTGLVTPLAFAALAAASPPQRLGQTMGSAEIGRELGDAGGPILVGALGAAFGLASGLAGLAVLLGLVAAVTVGLGKPCKPPMAES